MTPNLVEHSRFKREVRPLTPFIAQRSAPLLSKSTVTRSSEIALDPPSAGPLLLPPSQMRLILFVNSLENTQQAIVQNFCQQLSTMTSESSQQAGEYQRQLKEKNDRADTSLFWSMLKKVWTAFFSAVTMLFGASNIASGNVVIGAALIASGGLSIATLVFSDMFDEVAKKLTDDEEQQKQIAFYMQLSVNIVIAGLALFGGAYNFAQTQDFFSKQLGFALFASLSILHSIVEIGQGITQARLLYSEADLLKIQTALESTQIQTRMCSEALASFFATTQQNFERLSKIVDMSAQTNLSLLQA